MARMHARRRGKSSSKRPVREKAPSWQPLEPAEIEETIVKLAREGKPPAHIGLLLRDQYGVPSIRLATGRSLHQILEARGLSPKIPEDIQSLIRRTLNLRLHLEAHPKDFSNARGLTLIESKIRRLAKYYKRKGRLSPEWTYTAESAQLAVE